MLFAHRSLAQLALKKRDYKTAIQEATFSLNHSKSLKRYNLQLSSLQDLYEANYQLKKHDIANEIQKEISNLYEIINRI